jgi:hypothetical protein
VSSIECSEQFLHDLPGSFFLRANKKELHNGYHFTLTTSQSQNPPLFSTRATSAQNHAASAGKDRRG